MTPCIMSIFYLSEQQLLCQEPVKQNTYYNIIGLILCPILPWSDGSKDYHARFSCAVRHVQR